MSVPSDVSTCPLLPTPKAAGSPLELPTIIEPLVIPAILARVTALSTIEAVTTADEASSSAPTASSAKCSLSIDPAA